MQRRISLVLVLAVLGTACASPVRVHPFELVKLNGYETGDEVVVRTVSGTPVTFRNGARLGILLLNGDEIAHPYDRIEIIDDVFYGVVSGTESQVAVSLLDMAGVRLWPSVEGEYPEIVMMIATVWLAIGLGVLAVWAIVRYVDWDDVHVVVTY